MIKAGFKRSVAGFTLDVALELPSRGVTALFGPSGSGKTTVLNIMAGLAEPDEGYLKIKGRWVVDTQQRLSLPAHKRNVGYVFQDARLFPHMTVKKNLLYPTRFKEEGAGKLFDEVVAMLGLERLVERKPGGLSGGEKQRVAIGRALLAGPELLLMDEPMASLDEQRKNEIIPYLRRLKKEWDIPIIFVSHNRQEVEQLADRVVTIENGRLTPAPEPEKKENVFRPFTADLSLPASLYN